jgi:hypothetical protein
MTTMRVDDPNPLINIAHVVRNNVVTDTIGDGTVRTVANYSAPSQCSSNTSQIKERHALVRVLRRAGAAVLHE